MTAKGFVSFGMGIVGWGGQLLAAVGLCMQPKTWAAFFSLKTRGKTKNWPEGRCPSPPSLSLFRACPTGRNLPPQDFPGACKRLRP